MNPHRIRLRYADRRYEYLVSTYKREDGRTIFIGESVDFDIITTAYDREELAVRFSTILNSDLEEAKRTGVPPPPARSRVREEFAKSPIESRSSIITTKEFVKDLPELDTLENYVLHEIGECLEKKNASMLQGYDKGFTEGYQEAMENILEALQTIYVDDGKESA